MLDTKVNVPLRLKGDSLRLGLILINLVGNAIKFTDTGDISIGTELLAEDQHTVFLQFSVRDSGIGMTSQQMKKLFQEFSQGDASVTRKFGGTGLGLVISKRLVEMMGGTIGVKSDLGHGSCFTFTALFDKAIGLKLEPPMLAEMIRGLRILVVDDNQGARQNLAGYLKFLTYDPVCVVSGEIAVETLIAADAADSSFDLVGKMDQDQTRFDSTIICTSMY